jgi:hypothetical protein
MFEWFGDDSNERNLLSGGMMMGYANFQAVRLGRGRHRSAEDGACVMELASMLAGSASRTVPSRCAR